MLTMRSGSELPFIESILRTSGKLLMLHFGDRIVAKRKTEKSQIVTVIDVASEKLLIKQIVKKYPKSSILAEESGFVEKDPNDVWIIDPIDGTSNFANGLPWFGVMVAHVMYGVAVSSGVYLPVSDEMYLAAKGEGACKNGKKFSVLEQDDLSLSLIAFGTDGSEKSFPVDIKGKMYAAILPMVLNIRTTNSIVDFVYAAEGKLGGLICLESRIWDIAPIIPIAIEAACMVTDSKGKMINLEITKENIIRNYTLLLASTQIHPQLLKLVRDEVRK